MPTRSCRNSRRRRDRKDSRPDYPGRARAGGLKGRRVLPISSAEPIAPRIDKGRPLDASLQIVVGLALLTLGGEGVVRGTVGIARRLGLSELLIGLTLVGFGTSTPELLTSIDAALRGAPGIALGNVIGSNIANILLILGLAALARPIAASAAAVGRDGVLVILVSVLLAWLALSFGELTREHGAILTGLLVVYVAIVWWLERPRGVIADRRDEPRGGRALWSAAVFAFGGLALLAVGADLLVQGAVTMARVAGISEATIGLTVVAVGTSLPELVTSFVAAIRGRSDMALGNIVGSNMYNVLGVLGITALVHPVAVAPDIGIVDWIVFIGSAALLIVFARTGARITRGEGAVFLALYAAYGGYLLAQQGVLPTLSAG